MSILSRFGIGAARVDLIPDQTQVRPGEQVEAHLELSGGTSAQTVDDIEIALVTRYRAQREDDSYPTAYVLWETEFKDGFTVEPEVERSIDVPDIEVPIETPVTLGETEVWIQTGLDIDWALDPSDEDQIEVQPGPSLQAVLGAMEALGFSLQHVSNEEAAIAQRSAPFLQRFHFAKSGADGAGPTEVYLWPEQRDGGEGIRVSLTLEALAGGEAPVSIDLGTTDVEEARGPLKAALDRL